MDSIPIRTLDQSWLLPFEGVDLLLAPGRFIRVGDIYLAKRNGDWKMLTCLRHETDKGYIISEENAYPYNTFECWKVLSIREKLER